jgi:hypothetical protein
LMLSTFPGLSEKRAKKAVKDLRKNKEAELPIVRRQVNAPEVKTLAPDGDFFFPPYVTDPQRAPYCFWKTYYTAQELLNKVTTDGWDADFVEHVIDKYRGVNIDSIEREQEGRRSLTITDNAYEAEELIEIVYGYQRLIDREDGSEGIYCTVFHKDFSGDESTPGFAKFELLNGYEDYPVVVTKLSEDSKRLYDVQTIPDILRGIQNQVKVERDSRIDRNSLATLPPILHPVGQAPTDWGPGRMIPYRRKGDLDFADWTKHQTLVKSANSSWLISSYITLLKCYKCATDVISVLARTQPSLESPDLRILKCLIKVIPMKTSI